MWDAAICGRHERGTPAPDRERDTTGERGGGEGVFSDRGTTTPKTKVVLDQVQGVLLRVSGLRNRVWGLGCRVLGVGSRVSGVGFRL